MERELKLRINVATEAIKKAEKEIKNLEGTMEKSMGSANKATQTAGQAQQKYEQQTKKTTKATKQAVTGQQAFTGQMQNLTKSVQVALGPLSGVAARITATTALFNRNAASIAAVITAFTGFTVAMGRAIRSGQEFQREMMGIQSVIQSTGRSSVISAEQINELARAIGRDTLSSANAARQAMTQLSTFRNVSVDAFEEATLAAQGMSVAMGGNLQSNIRRIGRLLNEPSRNLDSLARQGVEFNRVEREKIEILEESGRVHEAQAMILQRMSTFSKLAKDESQGLAGAFDTLGERVNQVFEESAAVSSLLEELTDVVNRFTERLVNFLENDAAVERLGEVFSKTAQIIGKSLLFLIDNLGKIAAVIAGQVAVSLTRALIPALMLAGTSLRNLSVNAISTTAALHTTAGAMALAKSAAAGLTAAARSLFVALGPLTLGITAVSLAYSFMTRDVEKNLSMQERAEKQAQEEIRTREKLRETIDNESNARIRAVRVNQLNQQSIMDSMNATARSIRLQMDEVRGGRELYRMTSESREQYERLREQLNELNKSRREQRDRIDESNEGIEEEVKRLKDQENQRNQLEESIHRLIRSYDDEAAAAMDAARETKVLEQAISGIIELDDEEILILARNLGLIAEQSDDAAKATMLLINRLEGFKSEVGKSNKETRDMSREIDRARNSFQQLHDQVRMAKAEMKGSPLGFDLADVRRLENLNLSELGQIMDVSEARSEAEARRMIAAAMQEQRQELERIKDIQSIMEDPLGGRGVSQAFTDEMGTLRADYERERQALLSVDSATSDEALRILERRFAREKQMMRQEHADIVNIEQELRQMQLDQMDPTERINAEFQERRAAIEEAYEGELHLADEHFRKLEELESLHLARVKELVLQERQDIIDAQMGQHRQLVDDFSNMLKMMEHGIEGVMTSMSLGFGMMADIAGAALGETSTTYKRFAQAQAIMAGALAVTKAYSEVPYPANIGVAAMIGAKVGAQVATIESQGFADGGMVRGPGGPTTDSIPAMLSDGEFVMTADAVNRIGAGNLSAINEGQTPTFAEGGPVGSPEENQDRGGSESEGIRIINVMDESVVADFMNSSRGERIVTNIMSKNQRYSQRSIR